MLIDQDNEAAALRRGTRRFLIFCALVAVGVVAAILVRQGLFRQTANLSFVADTAQDIAKGQAVRIAGFRVGAVDDVNLRDDGKVEARIAIDANYMRFVTQDARVELRKEGLVGSPTLEIVSGSDKTRLAAAEARLAFTRADGLSALANQVRDEFIPILRDIKVITGVLADPVTGLPGTLAQVRATTANLNALLDTGRQQAGAVGGAATLVLDKAALDLEHFGRTLETANARLPKMMDKVQSSIEHVEMITAEARHSVPPALRDGSAVISDVREIVGGAKQSWPVRNWVDAPAPSTLKADSDPRGASVRDAAR